MYIKASVRSRLTTSLFSTTFIIAVLTVASPQLLPCPVKSSVGAETGSKERRVDKSDENQSDNWNNKDVVVVSR
jgi:hypothetical protein